MAAFDKFKSIRVSTETGLRLAAPAKRLGWSVNKLADECVRSCLAMIDDPSARTVPSFILLLDALHRTPPKLKAGKLPPKS